MDIDPTMKPYFDLLKLAERKGYKAKFKWTHVTEKIQISMHESYMFNEMCWMQKWLRDEKGIDIDIDRDGAIHTPTKGYKVTVYSLPQVLFHWHTGDVHRTYEEALLTGLTQVFNTHLLWQS
jgi:hypothetical protein